MSKYKSIDPYILNTKAQPSGRVRLKKSNINLPFF